MDDYRKKALVAVITNLAYVLASFYLWEYNKSLGRWTFVLGIFSGIHHYWFTDFTRKMDYYGMYAVIACLLGSFFMVDSIFLTVLAGGVASVLLIIFSHSRTIVGAGIIILLGALGVKDIKQMLQMATLISVAYAFNFISDNLHRDHYSLIHGVWHVITAYIILLGGIYI